MFAGIVEKRSKVALVDRRSKNLRVTIEKPIIWNLSIGQSVNVDGVCSTVVQKAMKNFSVEYMPETLKKTAAKNLRKGSVVNLERSLKFGDRIDGHVVQGHVDARAKVVEVSKNKQGHLLSVSLPKELLRYVAQRGSIAINGVSLTIARLRGNIVTVALIPHTLAHTNLGLLKKGDEVNVETDLFARYGKRAFNARVKPHAKKRSNKKSR